MKRGRQLFAVDHFAGNVKYDIENFVWKNTFLVPRDIQNVLAKSENRVLSCVFQDYKPTNNSINFQFRQQLNELMKKLQKTDPLYIRCIKPNDCKRKELFESGLVISQLMYSGILDCIKVRKAGFEIRQTYASLVYEWHILIHFLKIKRNVEQKQVIGSLLQRLARGKLLSVEDGGDYKLGRSKLFFRFKLKNKIIQIRDKFIIN